MTEYRLIALTEGYRVGDDGSAWSCWGKAGGRAKIRSVLTDDWRRLVAFPNKHGYLCVSIGAKRRLVHRLVLEEFVGPCPPGMECRHLDGDNSNNALGNICWGTKLENAKDKEKHGTTVEGEKNPQSLLVEEEVREMRRLRKLGWSLKRLSARFKVGVKNVSMVCTRAAWRHVP